MEIGEPTFRSWSSAKPSSTKAPFAPSSENTACDPSFHSSATASAVFGVTAVTNVGFPYTRASPVRTLATDSTPLAFSAASAVLTGIGEKLFCAVIA